MNLKNRQVTLATTASRTSATPTRPRRSADLVRAVRIHVRSSTRSSSAIATNTSTPTARTVYANSKMSALRNPFPVANMLPASISTPNRRVPVTLKRRRGAAVSDFFNFEFLFLPHQINGFSFCQTGKRGLSGSLDGSSCADPCVKDPHQCDHVQFSRCRLFSEMNEIKCACLPGMWRKGLMVSVF